MCLHVWRNLCCLGNACYDNSVEYCRMKRCTDDNNGNVAMCTGVNNISLFHISSEIHGKLFWRLITLKHILHQRYCWFYTVIDNESLRKVLSKGPKNREPRSTNCNYNFKILMDAKKDYARKWIKREQEETDSLSEWIKAVSSLIWKCMKVLNTSMSFNAASVFSDPGVAKTLFTIYDKYFVVTADKTLNGLYPMFIIRGGRRK